MESRVIRKQVTIRDFNKPIKIASSHKIEIVLQEIDTYVLEMEDVCFHEGSGLLLPDNPAGSREGEASSNEQKRVGGVGVIALVLRQFMEDPNKKLLIVGHNDTVGDAKESFEISKRRAEGVYYLLIGNSDLWCNHAFNNHTLKDCQQIMKYFHYDRGWNCDPGEIDGIWGRLTERATKNFFDALERYGYCKKKIPVEEIINSSDKRWQVGVWEGIYKLYEDLIFRLLIGSRWTSQEADGIRMWISFVDEDNPYIGCGESFPLDKFGKDNFRSQKNRRVEFLFFDKEELPSLPLRCPQEINRIHEKTECPLHNLMFYKRIYIKPADIHTVTYHLKFEYFDRIKEERCDVPCGLEIKVLKQGKPHPAICSSKNGLYIVKVLNVPNGKREDDIVFTFETKNMWIYTKDKQASPKIVSTFADIDSTLPKDPITREELQKRTFLERLHYYDLPERWDSRNWYCEIDQKRGSFNELCKEVTSTTSPMRFCLDDIVLVDEKGSMEIRDKDENNNPKPLDSESRVSLFYVKGGKLELYKPEDSDAPYFSDIPFNKNIIHRPPGRAFVIAFSNDFYVISNLRTREGDFSKGHIVGCRIAKKSDSSLHFGEKLECTNLSYGHALFFADRIGNFELHYFNEGDIVKRGEKLVRRAFLLVYWSGRFISNSTFPVSQDKIRKFETLGMKNAKKRWEDKGYLIEPIDGGDIEIVPVFFFEAKKPHSGGKEKCLVTISNDPSTGWMSYGSSDMYWKDYDENDYLGIGRYIDIDGKEYGILVCAHEYGHATGKHDEYSYKNGDLEPSERNSNDGPFSQWYFGMPYSCDDGSMMVNNRAPRMRHFWYFVNWINERSKDQNKLGKFLQGKQFKVVYRFGSKELNYYLPDTPKDFRKIYSTPYIDRNVSTGTGTVDIGLYKIGEDETAYSLKVAGRKSGRPWDSICVVFIKIGVNFTYDKTSTGTFKYVYRPDGTPKRWEDMLEDKSETILSKWYKTFYDALMTLRNRFWSEDLGVSNRYFRNTYIYFFPIVLLDPFQRFDVNGNLIESVNLSPFTNFDIIVHLNDSAKIGRRGGKTLQVGNKTSVSWIVKYIFGKDDGQISPTKRSYVDITDLQFLENWLRNKLGSATLKIKGA